MRLAAVALASLAALVACAGGGAATAATELTITVWPRGRDAAAPPQRWTLRCEPAGGTLPRPSRACRSLLANRAALRPPRRDVACTQIYGGPQEALVSGTVRSARVWARFNRRNGCQISRWNRLAPLFPLRA